MSESTRPVTERTGAGKAQAPLLEMRDITKIFPGVVALSHVNLTIQQGKSTCCLARTARANQP